MVQRVFRVALVLDPAHQYCRSVGQGVGDYARDSGGHLLPFLPDIRPTRRSRPPADGVLLVSGSAAEWAADIRRWRVPAVAFGGTAAPGLPCVEIDNAAIGRLAAEYLGRCGVENFAFYTGTEVVRKYPYVPERLAVFASRLAELGKGCTPPPPIDPDHTDWGVLRRWVGGLPKPVGILTFNDRMALELLAVCRAAGVVVPEAVAVLGVDNDELLCALALPTLSSVIASHRRCGYLAAEMLHRRLLGEPCGDGAPPLLVPPEGIAERESTATALARTPELGAAVRIIRERFAERLTVRDVAEAVAVSRRRLEGLFREKLGRSPAEEMRRVRVEQAKTLLRDPRVPLKAVAVECGFSSAYRLRHVFEAETGLIPEEWRRQKRRISAP